ncbi:MAG: hypothetical protein JWO30_3067 [Fibrobacteres bacterium]|nr:hypothetical protein [Fibrobacterota bacterium]
METSTHSFIDPEMTTDSARHAVREGAERINRYTENLATKTPTLLFLFAALASMAVSAILQFRGKRQWSLFIGQWAPGLLLFGLYNKLSKTLGAD